MQNQHSLAGQSAASVLFEETCKGCHGTAGKKKYLILQVSGGKLTYTLSQWQKQKSTSMGLSTLHSELANQ